MSAVAITHIGGPPVLIRIGEWTLLTDPTFAPAGGSYSFGWGTGSKKLAAPALSPEQLPPIDAILLSHDHHDDNLDAAGRALLPKAGVVVTTSSGAKRIRPGRGLGPGERNRLGGEGGPALEGDATPLPPRPPPSPPPLRDGHV